MLVILPNPSSSEPYPDIYCPTKLETNTNLYLRCCDSLPKHFKHILWFEGYRFIDRSFVSVRISVAHGFSAFFLGFLNSLSGFILTFWVSKGFVWVFQTHSGFSELQIFFRIFLVFGVFQYGLES